MRFNVQAVGTKTTNLAGGDAYSQDPKLELVSHLLTSFVSDQFYRSAEKGIARLDQLLSNVDPRFAAKAAVYARTKYGMRSVSHVVAGTLAMKASGQAWLKDFLNAVVYRPDDITEIVAYYKLISKRNPSAAMKKGLGRALSSFNEYQLGKYRAENAKLSLVDCVNLLHPKHTPALAKLVKGELKATGTWEMELTQAGQKADNEEHKLELKKEAWKKLIEEDKIGYFALLRNLRNILEQAPEVLDKALAMLQEEKRIKASLVLPFRFVTAIKEIQKIGGSDANRVLTAIGNAVEISLNNVPEFPGKTLVVIDTSGSMQGKPMEIGSLFAAVLYKASNADLMHFSDKAAYLNFMKSDNALTIADGISRNSFACGTNFHAPFELLLRDRAKYDRIIILSDMQGWMQSYGSSIQGGFNVYKKELITNPILYSFDLQGLGSLQFPERNVYCLAGFSDKVFDMMKLLEEDRNALIKEIEAVDFTPKRKTKY